MSMFDDGFFGTTKIRLSKNVRPRIKTYGDRERLVVLGTGVVVNDGHQEKNEETGESEWKETPDFVDFTFICSPNAKHSLAVGLKGEVFRIFGNKKKKLDRKKMASSGSTEPIYKYEIEILDAELSQQFLKTEDFEAKAEKIAAEDENYRAEIGNKSAAPAQAKTGYAKTPVNKGGAKQNQAPAKKAAAKKVAAPEEDYDYAEDEDDIAF